MAAIDALRELSNDELDTLAVGIEAGTVSAEKTNAIAGLLEGADLAELERLVDDKPAVLALITAVEDATDMDIVPFEITGELPPPVNGEEEDAVAFIERLLSPTAGRDADFFFGIREALETGDAEFTRQLTQGTIDQLSDAQRERLADEAARLARAVGTSDMSRRDFPGVERATERQSGRTVGNYWQPLLDELVAGNPDEADILLSEGVDENRIEALFANSNVLNEFIEKVESNIRSIRGDRDGRQSGPRLEPSERRAPGTGVQPGVEVGEQIVDDTSRISGQSIKRDIGLEARFMDLMRDTGRCRQFDCFQPDNFFRLTRSEQRKFFDFTVDSALEWLVRRGEVTPQQLRSRGFPNDVIPTRD